MDGTDESIKPPIFSEINQGKFILGKFRVESTTNVKKIILKLMLVLI
jgi:hypothetical protein